MNLPPTTPHHASAESRARFDPVKLLGQVFAYAQHFRLMLLMLGLGLCAGMVYYLFAIPTYQSVSLVYVKGFQTPVQGASVPNVLDRGFITRFRSQLIQIGAAKRLGLVGAEATYESVLQHVPKIQIAYYDSSHIEVTVYAYDPEVVRAFPQAMIDEFLSFQERSWKEFRDEALDRYAAELKELDVKAAESLDSVSSVAKNRRLAEITIEQQSLLDIPRRLVEARERIQRMDEVRSILSEFSQDLVHNLDAFDAEEAIRLLALLTKLEEDTVVKVGDVVATNLEPGSSPVTAVSAENRVEATVVAPSSVDSLQPWRELELKRRNLEARIVEASLTYLPDSSIIQNLKAEIAEIERALALELHTAHEKFGLEYQRLNQLVRVLESRMPEYHAISKELSQSSGEFASASNQKRMWDMARESLSQKLAAITFTEDFDTVQMRFKEFLRLRDQIPVSPNKSKLFMMSLILGLGGAFAVPTLLNLFNTSASTIQQLEEATGLNGIGIVPMTSKEFLEDVHRSPAQGATVPNYLLECFRVIRSNICLLPNRQDRSQVVLVTSARPQEGKTTQSANLAWAFHSMGERTLLIDCDLRRGRVHGLLDLENQNGLTRLLMENITIQEAIHATPQENFDAIPRGPVIAGTTELLCQKPFEDLITLFRKHYDRIVIDSPPVLGLSESSSLQRLVDGTVLVVRAEKTSRKDVMDAITLLRKSGAHFFGFVLNAVDLSKASNYYYYYYYSAPYYDQFGTDEEPPDSSSPRPRSRAPRPAIPDRDPMNGPVRA